MLGLSHATLGYLGTGFTIIGIILAFISLQCYRNENAKLNQDNNEKASNERAEIKDLASKDFGNLRGVFPHGYEVIRLNSDSSLTPWSHFGRQYFKVKRLKVDSTNDPGDLRSKILVTLDAATGPYSGTNILGGKFLAKLNLTEPYKITNLGGHHLKGPNGKSSMLAIMLVNIEQSYSYFAIGYAAERYINLIQGSGYADVEDENS